MRTWPHAGRINAQMTKEGDLYEVDADGDWTKYASRENFPATGHPVGVVTVNKTLRGALVRTRKWEFYCVSGSKQVKLKKIYIKTALVGYEPKKRKNPETKPACINLDRKTRHALERIDFTLAESVRTCVDFYIEHHPKLMDREVVYKPNHAKRLTLRKQAISTKYQSKDKPSIPFSDGPGSNGMSENIDADDLSTGFDEPVVSSELSTS